MSPHPFNSGGRTGIPGRGCAEPGCSLPDRDPIHQTPFGQPLASVDDLSTTWVRCGNCKKQYQVPKEQPYRYRAVMAHKSSCPEGTKEAVEAQHEELVRDFVRQQARPPVTQPWWKFWRRGQ